MSRNLILGLTITAAAMLAACEPGTLTSDVDGPAKPVATGGDGELMACCQEPTPSLADLRAKDAGKAAANDDAAKAATDAGKTTAKGSDEADAKPAPGISPVEEREILDLGFTFTDQDGKPFDLKSIKGKPAVATFIFTRCPNAQMCPMQAAKMAALQSALAKEGAGDDVNLLLFTFDPDYDTPARLKTWGAANGVKFTNARMLRPDPRDLLDFKDVFQFRAFPTASGELTHKTDLFLIDSEGRLAAFYAGMWDDDNVKGEVVKLIDEVK